MSIQYMLLGFELMAFAPITTRPWLPPRKGSVRKYLELELQNQILKCFI